MTKQSWPCQCYAETYTMSGHKRTIDFCYDGLGDIDGKGLTAFRKRIRKPYLWDGVEITFISPLGQTVTRTFQS